MRRSDHPTCAATRLPILLLLFATFLGSCRANSEQSHSPALAENGGNVQDGQLKPELEVQIVGNGTTTVLFLATIHGNESAGTALLERLGRELLAHPEHLRGKRAILVPVVNPHGFAAGRRGNAAGVDLNRNFPTGNQAQARNGGAGPLSEPETRVIVDLVERHQPARVISIHQPLGCVDYDGPAEDLAELLSQATGLPVRQLGGRPGSLGTWLGVERDIPTITLELPGRVEPDPEALWARYGPALLLFLEPGD